MFHPRHALIALCCLLGSTANAQSQLRIFGTLDMSVANVTNSTNGSSASVKQLRTDGFLPSRLVIAGSEDLGGSNLASFVLDAAVNPDTGTSNAVFWNRRATVSISNPLGEIRLGHDFDPSFWNISLFDPFGNSGIAAAFGLVNNLGSSATTLFRTNNSIGYFLPNNLGGLYGQAMLAAGEGVAGNAYKGARLGYAGGPFNGAVAYGVTKTQGSSPDYTMFNIAASWNFGVAKVTGEYLNFQYDPKKQQNYQLGLIVPVGSGEYLASFIKAKVSGGGTDGNDGSLMAVGYRYHFSKTTTVYATASRISNSGAAAFSIFGSSGSAKAGTSTGLEVGLRKSF